MSTRDDLDRQMRAVLAELSVCSHVPARAWGPTGRSRGGDEPPGGGRPPGDLGPEAFARRYGSPFHTCTRNCRHRLVEGDTGREFVLGQARAELRSLRGGGLRRVVVREIETLDELKQRIVADGEGKSVNDAAVYFCTGQSIVRAARREADRDLDFGRPAEPMPDPARRRARARELKAAKYSTAQIAWSLGVSRRTVARDLGEAA